MRTAATELLPLQDSRQCRLSRLDRHARRAEVLHRGSPENSRFRPAVGAAGQRRRDRPGGAVPGRTGQRLHHRHRFARRWRPLPSLVVEARQRRQPLASRQARRHRCRLISPFEPRGRIRPVPILIRPARRSSRRYGREPQRSASNITNRLARSTATINRSMPARLARKKPSMLAFWILAIGLSIAVAAVLASSLF